MEYIEQAHAAGWTAEQIELVRQRLAPLSRENLSVIEERANASTDADAIVMRRMIKEACARLDPPLVNLTEPIDSLLAGADEVIYVDLPPAAIPPASTPDQADPEDECHDEQSLARRFSKFSAENIEQRRESLKGLTTLELRHSQRASIEQENWTFAFIAAQEFTRRGVPPMLRRLGIKREEQSGEIRDDLLTYDLEWLAMTYPDQLARTDAHGKSSRARNYQAVFRAHVSLEHFLRGISHVFSHSHHYEPWDICKDLKLTDEQQWECRYIHNGEIGSAKRKTFAKSEQMRTLLAAREMGGRCGKGPDDRRVTIQRRHDIWFISQITGREHPTEIARLYRLMTGDKLMTKGIIARQLDKIPQRMLKPKP